MNQHVSANQAVINELHGAATSAEDIAVLDKWQREHNEARARLGRTAEDPALQHVGHLAVDPNNVYSVDSGGHVHTSQPEDHGAYKNGRRS